MLALILGLGAPIAETIRRWGSWRDYPPAILDDYLLGAMLLWGFLAVRRDPRGGRAVLASAWGFACGLGYYSFFEQVRRNRLGEVDPASIPSSWVAVIKGVGLAVALAGLILTLWHCSGEERESGRAGG